MTIDIGQCEWLMVY